MPLQLTLATLRFGPRKDLSVLFIHAPFRDAESVAKLWRVTRNVPGLEVLSTEEVVAYDVLKYSWVVIERDAIEALAGDGWFEAVDKAFDTENVEMIEDAPAQA